MEYLIIDGYNVINAWGHVFDLKRDSLEDCRMKLLSYLSNYQGFRKNNIIVVFDAHLVKKSLLKIEKFDNVTVVFTKENETADNYIERFVYQLGGTHVIKVVTSDYLEQTIIMSSGGIRMAPRELWDEIGTAVKNMKDGFIEVPDKSNTLASHMKPEQREILEKIRRGKF